MRGGEGDEDDLDLPSEGALASSSEALGNIGSRTTELNEQLDSFRNQYMDTMTKQRASLEKYRALQELTRKLSAAFLKNMNVIIDVSHLLNGYKEFLTIVKSQTSQINMDMDKFGPADFDYIRNLTSAKIVGLADEFKKSVVDLKSLYSEYNMKQEFAQVEVAEKQMDALKQEANSSVLLENAPTLPQISPAPAFQQVPPQQRAPVSAEAPLAPPAPPAPPAQQAVRDPSSRPPRSDTRDNRDTRDTRDNRDNRDNKRDRDRPVKFGANNKPVGKPFKPPSSGPPPSKS